jgi:hypothetical protein
MATITAALNVSSDISSYGGPTISNTMTMTKAGTKNGLERTSSVQRVYLTSTDQVDLLSGALTGSTVADMTLSSAAKVYIKYLEADTSKYLTVGFGTAGAGTPSPSYAKSDAAECFELGRLYGDEWMIIPWSGVSADGDIVVYPNVATAADEAIVEYIVFFD